MTQEQLRMQMLSGIITESEYKTKLEELNSTEQKDSLNEHYIAGGIVGVGAINNPFEGRKKESYEDAFEHFLGQKYDLNEVEEGKEVEEPSLYEEDLKENNGLKVVANILEKIKNGAEDEEIIAYMMDNNFKSEEQAKDQLSKLKGALNQMKQALGEDVVKGPNVKEVNGKWRVLSGKSGKMWPQTYDSKKDAEDAIKAYHANK